MQLNPVASTVLVIVYFFTSLSIIVILGIFLYLLQKVHSQLESLEARISPLLARTEEVLSATNEKIATIGERTGTILTHGEAVAEDVHEKVDRTATSVQRTINAPIISLNSIAAGLTHGIQTFNFLQRKRGLKGRDGELRQSDTISPDYKPSGSPDPLTLSVVDTAKNSNEVPVALRAGRE